MGPGMATRLRAGWSGFRIPVLASDFSRHQNFQTGYGAHLNFFSVATGVLFPRKIGLGVNETPHLYLMPRLSMSGGVRLFPLYAFRRGQGKLCPFIFFCWVLLSVPQTCDQSWTYAACEIRGSHSVFAEVLHLHIQAYQDQYLRMQDRLGGPQASYSDGTVNSYPVAKASEDWSWPLSLVWYGL
jgi:hypothetical protein